MKILPNKYFSGLHAATFSQIVKPFLQENDPFLIQTIQKDSSREEVLQTICLTWMMCLFSQNVPPALSFPLLDLLISFGAWSMVPISAGILQYNRQIIMNLQNADIMDEIIQIINRYTTIENAQGMITFIYELCLRCNIHQILEWYEQYHHQISDSSGDQMITRGDGQDGIVSMLRKDGSTASPYKLHLRFLTEEIERVRGVDGRRGRDSMGSPSSSSSSQHCTPENPNHIPSFSDYNTLLGDEEDLDYEMAMDYENQENELRLSFIEESNSRSNSFVENAVPTECMEEPSPLSVIEEKGEKEYDDQTSYSSTSISNFTQVSKRSVTEQIVGMVSSLTEQHVYLNTNVDNTIAVGDEIFYLYNFFHSSYP